MSLAKRYSMRWCVAYVVVDVFEIDLVASTIRVCNWSRGELYFVVCWE